MGLTYYDGTFRIPWVYWKYQDNLQILKELRLLELEQPPDDFNEISFSGLKGITVEHLIPLLTFFDSIK